MGKLRARPPGASDRGTFGIAEAGWVDTNTPFPGDWANKNSDDGGNYLYMQLHDIPIQENVVPFDRLSIEGGGPP